MSYDDTKRKDMRVFSSYEDSQMRRKQFYERKGGSFRERVFTNAVVDEALSRLETWHDDSEKGSIAYINQWGSHYIREEVMEPLTKALLENESLLTLDVWSRIKKLTLHNDDTVRGAYSTVLTIAKKNPQYMDDAREVLTNVAQSDSFYFNRQHAICGLRDILNLSHDPVVVDGIEDTLIGIARNDENDNVRGEALNQIDHWADWDSKKNALADPVRIMKKLAPLLRQKNVAGNAGSHLHWILWSKMKEMDVATTQKLQHLFQAQAEGTTGWLGGRTVRKAVKYVTDTIDIYFDFLMAAQDESDPVAQTKAATRLEAYYDLHGLTDDAACAQKGALVLECLAPLMRDDRPQVKSRAEYLCKEIIYRSIHGGGIKNDDIPALRSMFQKQADSVHWWELFSKSGHQTVLRALEIRERNNL